MKIDPAVEEPTRKILDRVLHDDLDVVESTVAGLVEAGRVDESLALACRIAGTVVVDINGGAEVTHERLDELARELVEIDAGRNGLGTDEVSTFLKRVVFGGERLDIVLSVDDAVRVPYAVAATLVGSGANVEDDQQWPDYLDEIEAAIEAAPDPS